MIATDTRNTVHMKYQLLHFDAFSITLKKNSWVPTEYYALVLLSTDWCVLAVIAVGRVLG